MKNLTTFICATPLQILIVLGLIKQLNLRGNVEVVVVGYFAEADSVAAIFGEVFEKKYEFIFFKNYVSAVDYVIQNNRARLFVHWDIGLRTNIFIRRILYNKSNTEISLYEEGLGTYRKDIYTGLKKRLIQLMRLPTILGSHKCVKKIYVYLPSEYAKINEQKKEIIKIQYSVNEVIKFFKREIVCAFDQDDFLLKIPLVEKSCALYLTSWKIDNSFLKQLKGFGDLAVVKPHPHIVRGLDLDCEELIICPAKMPAELLIEDLSVKFESVRIYHHGSSAERYVDAHNVEFIKITS